MSELTSLTCQVFHDTLTRYSLLEIMHHEVGNGLAVIAGYTQLLQRSSLHSATEESHDAKQEFYLSMISQREAQLNHFLEHIRAFSRYAADTRFCQTLSKTDFSLLLKRPVDRLRPLFKHKKVHMRWPAQPLFIRCDPLWM
ncbi:MAG: HAMP domain-containing histidine kinase, partial [Ktedonobacteraceae bacterium]|nr:HAMP domain-containing histidine kinase [Ktedonobacteraceae bacterium]